MPRYEYKGHQFESDHELSDEEWSQTLAYFDSLPAPKEAPSSEGASGAFGRPILNRLMAGADVVERGFQKGFEGLQDVAADLLLPEVPGSDRGVSQDLGAPARSQVIQESLKQQAANAAEHPIAAIGGELTGGIGNILLGAPAGPVGMATAFGAPSGMQRYHEVLSQGGSEEEAALSGVSRAGLDALGVGLAPAFGAGLASRMASGAGINVGLNEADIGLQNVINADNPAAQLKQFDPLQMALAGGLGAAAGGLTRPAARQAGQPQPTPTPTKPGAEPARDLSNIGADLLRQDNQRIDQEIAAKQVETEQILDMAAKEGELAPHQAERLRVLQEDLQQLQARREANSKTADDALRELEQQPSLTDLGRDVDVSGVRNPFLQNKEAIRESIQPKPTEVLEETPVVKPVEEAPVVNKEREKFSSRGIEDETVLTRLSDDTLPINERVSLAISDLVEQVRTRQKTQIEAERTILHTLDNLPELWGRSTLGVTFSRTLSEFPKTLKAVDMFYRLAGLHRTEKLRLIDGDALGLADLYPNNRGVFMPREDSTEIILFPSRMTADLADMDGFSPALRNKLTSFANRLKPEARKEFGMIITAAHEVGHMFHWTYLNKLMTNVREYKGLVKKYNDWVAAKSPTERAGYSPRVAVQLAARTGDNQLVGDYFAGKGDFAEFLAEQFTRIALFNKLSDFAPLNSFVETMSAFADKLMSLLRSAFGEEIDMSKSEVVSEWIKGIIKKNEESLNSIGKTLIEARTKDQMRRLWSKDKDMAAVAKAMDGDFSNIPVENLTRADVQIRRVDDVVQDQARMKDISMPSAKLIEKYFGFRQIAAIYDNASPVIKQVGNIIKRAAREAYAAKQFVWYGEGASYADYRAAGKGPLIPLSTIEKENSWPVLSKKATDEDFYEVFKVFSENYGRPYQEALANASHLSDFQKKLFEASFKVFERKLSRSNRFLNMFGKKATLSKVEGWYPSVRRGDYYVELRGPAGNVVYRQHMRTPAEARFFIDKWNKLPQSSRGDIVTSEVQEVVKDKMESQFAYDLVDTVTAEIAKHHRAGGPIKQIADDILDKYITRGGKFGAHHQFRVNLPGYMGSEIFSTKAQAGAAFRKAIINDVDEFAMSMRKLQISHMAEPLLRRTKDFPNMKNAHELAKYMVDMALNRRSSLTEPLDKAIKNTFESTVMAVANKFGKKNWFPQNSSFDKTMRVFGRLFMNYHLTGRMAFWVSSVLTAPVSSRTIFKEAPSLMDAMHSMAKGTWNLANPPEDLRKFIHYLSQKTESVHPQFINDLTTIDFFGKMASNKVEKAYEYLSGERASSASDAISRYWTAAMMFEHYKKLGYTGKELYVRAQEATNDNMVLYSALEKPGMWKELGVTGEAMSPLTQFARAQLGNLIADYKYYKTRPQELRRMMPMIATSSVVMMMGGVLGMAGLAEYELFRKGALWLWGSIFGESSKQWLASKWPSVIDWALKEGDSATLDRVISHGAVSAATGYDFGASMRWNPIINDVILAEKSWLDLFPHLSLATTMAKSQGTIASALVGGDVTDAELRKATLDLVPSGIPKAVVDMGFGSLDREAAPVGARGFAGVEQTGREVLAQAMGTRTTDTAVSSMVLRREQDKTKALTERKQRGLDMLTDSLMDSDRDQFDKAIDLLVEQGMSGREIQQQVKTLMQNRQVPQMMRFYANKKLNVKSREQQRRYLKLQEYGLE